MALCRSVCASCGTSDQLQLVEGRLGLSVSRVIAVKPQ